MSKKFTADGKLKVVRTPRTVNTPLNDDRMMPADLEAGMKKLSENLVRNTEYAMERMTKENPEDLPVTWRRLSKLTGLSTSTIYTIKNLGANSGTATAVQFARIFEVDPSIMFLSFDRFVVLFDAERSKSRTKKK